MYQIKCNQRKPNERNNSDRKIKSFCESFEQKRNYKSHIVYIYIQDVSINFYIASYNMIIRLKSLHHLLTVQLAYAQEVCCPLRLKCMWLTRCSYFGRIRRLFEVDYRKPIEYNLMYIFQQHKEYIEQHMPQIEFQVDSS